jgi:hypothetical protein
MATILGKSPGGSKKAVKKATTTKGHHSIDALTVSPIGPSLSEPLERSSEKAAQNSMEDSVAPRKPSEYIHDRLLSTGDKLALVSTRPEIPRIIELSNDTEGAVKQYQVPIDRPLFQPVPSSIALQSFEPFVTYEVVINFRNIDKVRLIIFLSPI